MSRVTRAFLLGCFDGHQLAQWRPSGDVPFETDQGEGESPLPNVQSSSFSHPESNALACDAFWFRRAQPEYWEDESEVAFDYDLNTTIEMLAGEVLERRRGVREAQPPL